LNLKFFGLVYHICLMLFVFVSFQHYTYGRGFKFSLSNGYCRFFVGVSYSSVVLYTEAMMMFWFEKLQVTYRSTYIALSRGLNRFFYMLVAVTAALALTLAIVIAVKTTCTLQEKHIDFNPFTISADELYTCGGYSRGLQAAYLVTAVFILCILCGILIYQYVTRYKSIVLNREFYEKAEYDDIERSCIVAVPGCVGIVLATILAASLANAGFANLCMGVVGVINGMFIICSFSWGDKLYYSMFGWYIRRKDKFEGLRKAIQSKAEENRETTDTPPQATPYKD